MDAHHGHVKSELEQLKNDIANATKQKQSICKALEKKVPLIYFLLSIVFLLAMNF